MPREGRLAAFPRAGDALRRDVPTCQLSDRVGEVRDRVRAQGWDRCVVVGDQRVVLGMLGPKALGGDPDARAEQVMDPGPVTFRAKEMLSDVAVRLAEAGVTRILVTTPEGRLLGLLERGEAERITGAASTARPADAGAAAE